MAFSPDRGWFRRWLRSRRAAERVLLEDALKYFYDCEYEGTPSTIASLAGTLEVSRDTATRLTEQLEKSGLMRNLGGGFQLTPEGRSYALRIIRTHRLWERYLADHTGLKEFEWHERADFKEHSMTVEQAEELSSQLGNPLYDPHGDPIPTVDGEMPSRRGVPLSSLEVGSAARVIHVEDEPHSVYAQLVAANLCPGITLRVLENTPARIRIEAEYQEHVLAPIVAANLTVEPIKASVLSAERYERLSELPIGKRCVVVDISPACHGVERRRLLDLGIVPGTDILAELQSMSGDPVGYRIRGAVIALRREQAEMIHVQTEPA